MRLKIKIILTTLLWAAAVFGGLGFMLTDIEAIGLWALIAAAGAAVLSAALAGDYIAAEASTHIVGRITAEREATVDRATRQMQAADKAREDRVVSRIQAINEAALKRVAEELVTALRDGDRPTRLR